MSPRAAWRLASLGYRSVFDYVDGKADWLAYGLPWDGTAQLIEPHLAHDLPTCRTDEPLSKVRARLAASPLDLAVVVTDGGVVLGRLDSTLIHEHDSAVTVDQVMIEGPTTVRPSEEIDPLVARMRKANIDYLIVTYPDGRLAGIFRPAAHHASG